MPVTVLQLCHCHTMPFADISQQYAELLRSQGARVITVFLTRPRDEALARSHKSDKTLFLELDSRQVRGLKLRALWRLHKICREERVDLVLAHRWKAIYLAGLLQFANPRLRVAGLIHALNQMQRRSRRLAFRLLGWRMQLLGVSDATRDNLRADLPKSFHSRVQTLYNFTDFERLSASQVSREEARETLNLPRDAWVFGHVGRHHPVKDQATLLRAFARAAPEIPGARLCLLGNGEITAELKQLAQDLGICQQVDFPGVLPDAARYMRAFDGFVLSSRSETFGMVLLEAMAADVPVVASDVDGVREVASSPAWRVPPKDPESLADRMLALARMAPEARAQLASEQLNHARDKFDFAVVARQLCELGLIPQAEREIRCEQP